MQKTEYGNISADAGELLVRLKPSWARALDGGAIDTEAIRYPDPQPERERPRRRRHVVKLWQVWVFGLAGVWFAFWLGQILVLAPFSQGAR